MYIFNLFIFQFLGAFWFWLLSGFAGSFDSFLAAPNDKDKIKYNKNSRVGFVLSMFFIFLIYLTIS